MAIKKVIRMGHPTLRQVAKKLTSEEILSSETKELIQDMFDTMKEESGIGIAAPQINISKQIALIEVAADNERYKDEKESVESTKFVIINPEIKILDETLQGFWEGCLSVPGLRGYVERPRKVIIKYLNEEAIEKEIIVEDFMATVFQHELDHLFGVLYVDRIKDTTKLSYIEEFEALMAQQHQEED